MQYRFAVIAIALAACGGGDPAGGVEVAWNLTSWDESSSVVIDATCPDGATVAIISATPHGGGEGHEREAPCQDRAGAGPALAPGRYDVRVRLTDDGRTTRYAESEAHAVDVAADATAVVPPFDIMVDHGYYRVGWRLQRGGNPLTCAQVGGAGDVAIIATDAGGQLLRTDLDCTEGHEPLQVMTRPLPSSLAGTQYPVSITLLDVQGFPIGNAAGIPRSADRALDHGNEVHDLGIVDIFVQ